jgi:hypothetical protein
MCWGLEPLNIVDPFILRTLYDLLIVGTVYFRVRDHYRAAHRLRIMRECEHLGYMRVMSIRYISARQLNIFVGVDTESSNS